MLQYITVSKSIDILKALKHRRRQLEELSEISLGETSQKVKTPFHNVIDVDQKVTEINNAIFEISSEIKQSNSETMLEFDENFDFKSLMKPIN